MEIADNISEQLRLLLERVDDDLWHAIEFAPPIVTNRFKRTRIHISEIYQRLFPERLDALEEK